MSRDAIDALLQSGARDTEFVQMFWDFEQTVAPGTTYQDLKARGFEIRLGSRTPLTDRERTIIQDAIILLSETGSEPLGRYKYIANWISQVKLQGIRTPTQVDTD